MSTVAEFTRTSPHAIRVLQRHRIDFCCGGGRDLTAASTAAGVTVDQLVAELSAEDGRYKSDERDWYAAPLTELIAYIVVRHHRPLDEELPRLLALADKVARVHGGTTHEAVRALTHALIGDLIPHMAKEEQVLFPWIESGGGAQCAPPIQAMRHEHQDVAGFLRELTDVTGYYTAPPEACGSWRALWTGLGALDADLRLHIHLENNILFPRALAGN